MEEKQLLKNHLGVAAAKQWEDAPALCDVQMHFTIDLETENGRKLKKLFEEFGICFRE